MKGLKFTFTTTAAAASSSSFEEVSLHVTCTSHKKDVTAFDTEDYVEFRVTLVGNEAAARGVLQIDFDGVEFHRTVYGGSRQGAQQKATIFRELITTLPMEQADTYGWHHFETYHVKQNNKGSIHQIDLVIENNQVRPFDGAPNYVLQPRVDMHGVFFERVFRVEVEAAAKNAYMCRLEGLPWIPHEHSASVDASMRPQRWLSWHKERGQHDGPTGSIMSTLLGFGVPKRSKKGPWKWEEQMGKAKRDTLDKWARARMRQGTLGEDYALMAVLHENPQTLIQECGLHTVPGRPGWRISPDGKIYDPDEPDKWGALEIKTSTANNRLEPTYIPQVYGEMTALQVEWVDIAKNHYSHSWQPTTSSWAYKDVIKVFRIYRNAELEREMFDLIQEAWDKRHADNFQQLVHEQRFVDMRKRIEAMAEAAQPRQIIEVEKLPELHALFDQYSKYLYARQQPQQIAVTESPMKRARTE